MPSAIYEIDAARPWYYKTENRIRVDEVPQDIPSPKITTKLSWQYDPLPFISVPDFILQSNAPKIPGYVSFRTRFMTPNNPANDRASQREWHGVSPAFTLDSDVILVYADKQPSNLALVAAKGFICRPDVVIKYRAGASEDEGEWLRSATAVHKLLKPAHGTFLFTKAALQTLPAAETLSENIHLLHVGLDPQKLAPVVEALSTSEVVACVSPITMAAIQE